MKLTIANKTVTVTAKDAVGKGGEADVYDLHNGLVVKVFKTPNDPDYQYDQTAREGARRRIAEQQEKLPAFPKVPPAVVAPADLARNGTGEIVGYAMEYLKGWEVLLRYGDRRFREQGGVDPNDVVALFRELHRVVSDVHFRSVVVGDFNDLNVLVQGTSVRLIDADSFQFDRFLCRTFTPRFLDPLRATLSGHALTLTDPLGEDSDWYAYAVMLFQSLLYVGPYGGVHRPKSGPRLQHDERVFNRITVYRDNVVYPKPAIPYDRLPDDLLQYFYKVFERDERGEFPESLLANTRWTTCTACGTAHARPVCPACATYVKKEPVVVRGNVKALRVFTTEGPILCVAYQGGKLRYLYHDGGNLIREDGRRQGFPLLDTEYRYRICEEQTLIGRRGRVVAMAPGRQPTVYEVDSYGHLPVFDATRYAVYWVDRVGQLCSLGRGTARSTVVRIGDVLPGRTLFWAGDRFGFGFYQAGSLTRAFVSSNKGLNDQVKLTDFRGKLVDTTCTFSDQRCWFFATLEEHGRLRNHVYVIDAEGRRLGHRIVNQTEDGDWLAGGIRGRFAVGECLYVPTASGIVRINEAEGLEYPDKEFPDTEPFVDETSYLLAGDGGIHVVGTHEITLLIIT